MKTKRKAKRKIDPFTHGYLCAAAQAARFGEDVLAEEMMQECGITDYFELDGIGLEAFDKSPLRRVLMASHGRR